MRGTRVTLRVMISMSAVLIGLLACKPQLVSTLEDDPAHPIALVTESPSHRLGSLSRL